MRCSHSGQGLLSHLTLASPITYIKQFYCYVYLESTLSTAGSNTIHKLFEDGPGLMIAWKCTEVKSNGLEVTH